MIELNRIYLDNAATSWPKPEAVYSAVDTYQRYVGVAAGRGSYRMAEDVARIVARVRLNVAKLINADSPEQIVLSQNCTDSLNLALHGLLEPGDHVVTSAAEHNSILRPLAELEGRLGIEASRVDPDGQQLIAPELIAEQLRPNTRMIAITHASNVTGSVQPIREIGQIARDHGQLFLVDAAQTLGHLPIDVSDCHIDLLAAPGHKGLLGPLGTGMLYVSKRAQPELRTVRQGGNRHPKRTRPAT